MAPEYKTRPAHGGASLTRAQRHRIVIAAAVAAAVDGPFCIVGVSPSSEGENRWSKSGRFRNRAQRPPSWAIQPASPREPEPPAEQGEQTS